MFKNELAKRVYKILEEHGLENPILFDQVLQWQNLDNLSSLEQKLSVFLQQLGFDLSSESLSKTPQRVLKLFINELFFGLNYQNFPEISIVNNEFTYTSPLFSSNIPVNSTCEHHLVSIKGVAIISYIPNKQVIGIGSFNKLVDFFAKRPQVQERLTRQIFVILQEILATPNIAIAINATHDCIINRGSHDNSSNILTLELGGRFKDDLMLSQCFYKMATDII